MATGSTIGGIAGMAIGSAIAPGAGTSVGGAIGSGIGGMIDAGIAGSGEPTPGLEDAEQRLLLEELRRKARSMNTGSEATNAINQASEGLAATQGAITNVTNGDIGATIAGLNKAQRQYGNNVNQIYANAENNSKFFTSASENLLDKIAGRKMELLLHDQDQARATAAQSTQDASANLGVGFSKLDLASLLKSLFNGGGPTSDPITNGVDTIPGAGADAGTGVFTA